MFWLLIFITAVFMVVWFMNNSDYWKKRNVVQVKGAIWDFTFGRTSLAEVYKKFYDSYPNEPYVGIYFGTKPALVLRDLEDVQAVFATDFQSFSSRGIVTNPNDILADNVLFIDDFGRWKAIRQKLSPVFTSAKLKNMFYIMERCARDFTDKIKENPEMKEKPFNALYTYTTASIAASIFGIEAQSKNTMDSPFLQMSWKTLQPSFKNNFSFFMGNTFPRIYKWLDLRTFDEFEDFFVGVVRDVLKIRRNETQKRHDFIDTCLELQNQGTIKDLTTGYELEPTVGVLAAQAFFFFLAGTDTSANTMHFTLLELSNHPKILDKVHEEIDKVFNSCDEKVSYNDIEKLCYMDMVVNEAMRKYPPIGLIQRLCTRDTTLPGGMKMEKGNIVVTPVFGIHRDAKYYPEPDVFDPERFSAENVVKIPKFAYLPFGEGNRICIGTRFARLQVKAGLAWLLRRYTLREQCLKIEGFERSVFGLRTPDLRYDLLQRNM